MSQQPTLADALGFLTAAAESDLDRLAEGIRTRRENLREIRAAAVTQGVSVRTLSLKPKYLTGLKGDVVEIETIRRTTCAAILLTPESTKQLRLHRWDGGDEERYTLRGIPVICCEVTSGDSPVQDAAPSA